MTVKQLPNTLIIRILNFNLPQSSKFKLVGQTIRDLSLVCQEWKIKIIPLLLWPKFSVYKSDEIDILISKLAHNFKFPQLTIQDSSRGIIKKEHNNSLPALLESVDTLYLKDTFVSKEDREELLLQQIKSIKKANKLVLRIDKEFENLLSNYLQSADYSHKVMKLEIFPHSVDNLLVLIDKLQVETLIYKKFSNSTFEELSKLSNQFLGKSKLRKVKFILEEYSRSEESDIKFISEFIRTTNTLESLSLVSYLEPFDIDPIIEALTENQSIKEFKFVDLKCSGIAHSRGLIVKLFQLNTSLKKFVCDAVLKCKKEKSSYPASINNSTLEYFQYNNKNHTSQSLLDIFSPDNSILKEIKITTLSKEVSQSILKFSKTLKSLNLYQYKYEIGNPSLEYLLKSLPNLENLNIVGYDIEDEEDEDDDFDEDSEDSGNSEEEDDRSEEESKWLYVIKAILQNRSLKTLSFDFAGIECDEIIPIIRNCKTLSKFELSQPNEPFSLFRELKSAMLSAGKNLSLLNLLGCFVAEETVHDLESFISKNQLFFEFNYLSRN